MSCKRTNWLFIIQLRMSKEHYMIYILFLCILSYKIFSKKAKWNIIELILIEWKYGHVLPIRKCKFCVLVLVNRITEEELKENYRKVWKLLTCYIRKLSWVFFLLLVEINNKTTSLCRLFFFFIAWHLFREEYYSNAWFCNFIFQLFIRITFLMQNNV